MKNASTAFVTTAVVTAALLLSGCGQSGGGAMVDDSPEGRAYQYRHAVMELAAAKNAILGGMNRGERPDDPALFGKAASDLATLVGMITEGFEQEGIAAGSRALPDIWTNMGDFDQKAADLAAAVQAVVDASEAGDFAGAKELAGNIGSNCGACHRPYRAPAD